jgi:hypothetical protein
VTAAVAIMRMLAFVLIMPLLAAAACSGAGSSLESPIPTRPPYRGPVTGYAVVTLHPEPLSGLYIKAFDPETGEDLPGREPIELGHHGQWSLSPDGKTLALAWSPTGDDDGPERLVLLDLATWRLGEPLYEGRLTPVGWSPDGALVYLIDSEIICEDVTFGVPTCAYAKHDLIGVEAAGGEVVQRDAVPTAPPVGLSPDGRLLYLFGRASGVPYGAPSGTPLLIAFDIEQGRVVSDLELPDVLYGAVEVSDNVTWRGSYEVTHYPSVALSPDGALAYIAHTDDNRITVVDLDEMRVVRSREIGGAKKTVVDRILSFFAGEAEAKDSVLAQRGISASPDGRLLYLTGRSDEPAVDENGELSDWQSLDLGLTVVDASTFEVVAKDIPADPASVPWAHQYRMFEFHPSGERVYAIRGAVLLVMEPATLRVIHESIAPFYDFLVAPAPPGGG